VALGAGVLLERGRQKGVLRLKRRHFAVIGSNNVKTVADGTYMLLIKTSTGDRLFGFINIDDLERP